MTIVILLNMKGVFVKMSSFCIGDQVRVVSDGEKFASSISVGDEGRIIGICPEDFYPIKVRFGTLNQIARECQIELTSKGGQNEMENLEAIAVVGDDDLKEKLAEIGEEHDYDVYSNSTLGREYVHFYRDGWHNDSFEVVGSYKAFDASSTVAPRREPDEENREILELPQDWEKAKKFVTQDFEEIFEVGGYEVEVDFPDFQICQYEGNYHDLKKFVEGGKEVGVGDSTELKIIGANHTYTFEQAQQLLDYLEDQK